jgi:hypothetical protein
MNIRNIRINRQPDNSVSRKSVNVPRTEDNGWRKMNNKYKIAFYALSAALPAIIAIPVFANMSGNAVDSSPAEIAARQQAAFQNEADILGIGVDAVKNFWAQGLTLQQMARQQGISDTDLQTKLRDARVKRTQADLQALVSQGVITQAQADSRQQAMQNKMNSMMQNGDGMMGGGMMQNGQNGYGNNAYGYGGAGSCPMMQSGGV